MSHVNSREQGAVAALVKLFAEEVLEALELSTGLKEEVIEQLTSITEERID